jgi:hypothetical protein
MMTTDNNWEGSRHRKKKGTAILNQNSSRVIKKCPKIEILEILTMNQ